MDGHSPNSDFLEITHTAPASKASAKVSADNDDPDITTLEEHVFTWAIEDWSGLKQSQYSPEFHTNGYKWRLYLFPEGNKAPSVSIYLDTSPTPTSAPDSTTPPPPAPESWAVCAQFGIVMWNPENPSVMTYNTANHRFNPDVTDWGFTQFVDLRKLMIPVDGNAAPLIANNKVNFSLYIRVLNDPTGVLWHDMKNYNSKKATGYTGLKNQGATCYLNSLLQSLYFTTAFRHAVLQIPTDNDTASVPYALQRIFTKLNNSELPVGTLQLTKSFGWDSGDEFTQHDVQELNRVLMDNLEGKMKGTDVQGALNKIFVGQFKSYIKCVNVDFESSRIEDYWDIQLNVKGLKNLEESFKDYVQVEIMDGENQYQATGYGLQDAKKGVVFKSFPPVLHLQLKRYDFDPITGGTVKINDRYEFPTEIDLSAFLDEDSRKANENNEYALHGVLVHCGDLNIGHYYALLKPTKDGPWYKFDDDKVTRATMKEVLDDNFGGDPPLDSQFQHTRPASFWRNTGAYMLVYVRKTMSDQILFEDTIPQHIIERERLEELEEQKRRRDREEQYLYMNVNVASAERQFKHITTFDIAVFPGRVGIAQEDQPKEAVADTLRVKKTTTPSQLLDIIQKKLYPDVDRKAMQLWSMAQRPNTTYRFQDLIPENSPKTFAQLGLIDKNSGDLNVFLEIADPDLYSQYGNYEDIFFVGDKKRGERMLLFLKHFDPITQTLIGVRTTVLYGNDTAGALIPIICKTMNWPLNTPVRLWEEIKPFMIDRVDPNKTLTDGEFFRGDVITFEQELSPDVIEKSVPPSGYKSPVEYYGFLCDRVKIKFRHRADPEIEMAAIPDTPSSSIEDYTVWINKNAPYKEVAEILAKHIGVDPEYLQFFVVGSDGRVRGSVKRTIRTLEQMIQQSRTGYHEIQYSILRMSLAEFENQKLVEFVWLPKEGNIHDQHHEILVSKSSALQDIVAQFPKRLGLSEKDLAEVTAWVAVDHRIYEVLAPSHPVISLQKYQTLIFSLASPQEHQLFVEGNSSSIRMVEVFNFYRDPSRAHGIPFKFALVRGEKLSQTKARLQKVLGMYDKVFERVKFAIVRSSEYGGNHESNLPEYVDNAYGGNGANGNANNNNSHGRSLIRYLVDGAKSEAEPGLASPVGENGNGGAAAAAVDGSENGGVGKASPAIDEIELFDEMTSRDALGLDHVDRTVRRNVANERAIFIKA